MKRERGEGKGIREKGKGIREKGSVMERTEEWCFTEEVEDGNGGERGA